MPWLFPLLLGAGAIGLAWAIFGGNSASRPQLPPGPPRRNPLLPPPQQQPALQPARPSIQPIAPAAPGVLPGMQQATQDAERAHGTPEPLSPPAITTTEPLDSAAPPPSSVPGLIHDEPEPQRPRVPPPIRRAVERDRLIEQTANPEVVEEHARGALAALRNTRISATARSEFLRRFQDAYGQGLRPDGVYGPQTRQALSRILGVRIQDMPPLARR